MTPAILNVRLFYAASVCGNLAYQVGAVAIAWHVFGLAHRTADLGLVGLVLFAPTILFALPAGVFADRHDRRTIVFVLATIEASAMLALALAVAAGMTQLGAYLALLFVIGTARAFMAPADRSLLLAIVAPEDYLRTQATDSSLGQIARIGGPALGGALVALDTTLAIGVAAAGLFAFAALTAALRVARAAPPTHAPTWHDALEGLRFVRSRPIVLGAISLDLFAVLFGGATALLPAFADGVFHIGPAGLGALRSAPALGAALVAAVIARRPIERNVGTTLLVAVAGFGLATIAFGLSRNVALSLALLACVGGTDMVSMVVRVGLVQLATPDAMRGRVNAVENVFIGASNELGEFESGALASLVGVVPCVVIGGIGTLAVIALWAALFPGLRRADRFVDDAAPA